MTEELTIGLSKNPEGHLVGLVQSPVGLAR